MRKILAVIGILVVFTLSIDNIWYGDGIDETEVLRDIINHSHIQTFTDTFYGYTVHYPDFFQPAEDNHAGCNRFVYHGRTNILIETRVSESVDELLSYADNTNRQGNFIVMEGDYYERGLRYENFRFHAKATHSGKLWLTYMIVYDGKYKESINRLIQMVDSR